MTTERPKQPYLVERIAETRTTILVYAVGPADARLRVRRGEGESMGAETLGTGRLGRVDRDTSLLRNAAAAPPVIGGIDTGIGAPDGAIGDGSWPA